MYPLVAVLSRHHECLVDGVRVDVHLGRSPAGTFLEVLTSAYLSRTPPEDNEVVLFSRVTSSVLRQQRRPLGTTRYCFVLPRTAEYHTKLSYRSGSFQLVTHPFVHGLKGRVTCNH